MNVSIYTLYIYICVCVWVMCSFMDLNKLTKQVDCIASTEPTHKTHKDSGRQNKLIVGSSCG